MRSRKVCSQPIMTAVVLNKCTGFLSGDKNTWNKLHITVLTVPTVDSNVLFGVENVQGL